MPIYQYRCPECLVTDEVEAPIQEGPPPAHGCLACSLFGPQIGIVWMKRVWSAVPFILKGGGWASKS